MRYWVRAESGKKFNKVGEKWAAVRAGSFITAIYRSEIHFDQGNFRNCAARLTQLVGQVSTGYQKLWKLTSRTNNLEEMYTDASWTCNFSFPFDSNQRVSSIHELQLE